jgi:hypothetical protein
MSWSTELVKIVRYLINDVEEPYTYSTVRLQKTILVGAQYVIEDIDWSATYNVDVDELTLSPDPTSSPKDNAFINLICLKAGCIIDYSTFRNKAQMAGIKIQDGQSIIDTKGQADLFKDIAQRGLCAEYERAKMDYQLGSFNGGRIIIGPASGPNINTFGGDSRSDGHFA